MIAWKCRYCSNNYYVNAIGQGEDSICPHCQRRQTPRVSLADDLREGRWDPRNGIFWAVFWKNEFGRAIFKGLFMYVAVLFVRGCLTSKLGNVSSQFSNLVFDACLLVVLLEWLKSGIRKKGVGGIVLAVCGYAFWAIARGTPWWGITLFWKGLRLFVKSV